VEVVSSTTRMESAVATMMNSSKEWQEHITMDGTRRKYYHNSVTGESQWLRPEGVHRQRDSQPGTGAISGSHSSDRAAAPGHGNGERNGHDRHAQTGAHQTEHELENRILTIDDKSRGEVVAPKPSSADAPEQARFQVKNNQEDVLDKKALGVKYVVCVYERKSVHGRVRKREGGI